MAFKTDYRVIEFTPEERDDTISHVEIWYNFEVNIWTIQYMTKEGWQIDAADYAHLKKQAIETSREHLKRTGNENVPIFVEARTTGIRKDITD